MDEALCTCSDATRLQSCARLKQPNHSNSATSGFLNKTQAGRKEGRQFEEHPSLYPPVHLPSQPNATSQEKAAEPKPRPHLAQQPVLAILPPFVCLLTGEARARERVTHPTLSLRLFPPHTHTQVRSSAEGGEGVACGRHGPMPTERKKDVQ